MDLQNKPGSGAVFCTGLSRRHRLHEEILPAYSAVFIHEAESGRLGQEELSRPDPVPVKAGTGKTGFADWFWMMRRQPSSDLHHKQRPWVKLLGKIPIRTIFIAAEIQKQ